MNIEYVETIQLEHLGLTREYTVGMEDVEGFHPGVEKLVAPRLVVVVLVGRCELQGKQQFKLYTLRSVCVIARARVCVCRSL